MRKRKAGESTSPSISPFSLPQRWLFERRGEGEASRFLGSRFSGGVDAELEFLLPGPGVDNGHGIARRGEHELDDDARDERVASGRGPLPGGRDGTPSMIAMPGK